MTLDDLYGVGAAQTFREKCDVSAAFPNVTATVIEASDSNGTVGVTVTWRTAKGVLVATCSIDFYPHRAHYTNLIVAAAFRGKGLYQQLILRHPAQFRVWGILVLTALPSTESPRSEYLLALGGFHWQAFQEQEWFAALTSNDRMSEYAVWLKEGQPPATEPAWHVVLREAPVPGGELY